MYSVSPASNPRPVPSCHVLHGEFPPLSLSLSRGIVGEHEGPDEVFALFALCPLGTRSRKSKKTMASAMPPNDLGCSLAQ